MGKKANLERVGRGADVIEILRQAIVNKKRETGLTTLLTNISESLFSFKRGQTLILSMGRGGGYLVLAHTRKRGIRGVGSRK
jgi:hypothetical protein